MNLTIVSEPPFEPVSLAQVYRQLRLTPDHEGSPGEETHPDDVMLSGHIKTAREFVETATRRSLVQRTWRMTMQFFPARCYNGWFYRYGAIDQILLRRPPLIRVERVRYYDTANALQTVDPADYYVADDVVPELRFATGFWAPAMYERPDALQVEYSAGYAPGASPTSTQEDYAANIPQSLKEAVLIGVQLLYDNLSESDRKAMVNMRESLMQTLRVQNL